MVKFNQNVQLKNNWFIYTLTRCESILYLLSMFTKYCFNLLLYFIYLLLLSLFKYYFMYYYINNYIHIYSFQNSPLKRFNNNKKHYASCITWQNSSLHTNTAIVLIQVVLNFYCIIAHICDVMRGWGGHQTSKFHPYNTTKTLKGEWEELPGLQSREVREDWTGLFLRGQLYFRISVMTSRSQRGVCQTLKSLPRGMCLCGPWGHTCKCLWDIKAVWCIRGEQSQCWQHARTHCTHARMHAHARAHTHTP